MTMRRWSRRTAIATCCSVAGSALAGCLDGSNRRWSFLPGSDGPTATVTHVEDPNYDLSVEHDVESWPRFDPDWEVPTTSPLDTPVEAEVLVENLEVPWDLSFAPNGDVFVSERTGTILYYDSESLEAVAEADVLDRADAIEPGGEGGWWAGGSEGGLLGIAIHPNYPDVPIVYAFYTYDEGGAYYNRLVYFDVSAENPTETETIVADGIVGHRRAHNGSRIAFGPENYLWVTTGDANLNDWELQEPVDPISQDLGSLAGKVLKLEPDGRPAPDNPDLGPGAHPHIYSYGHRNPQGITWLPDATPIVTEHGPANRDEVNVLEPGGNYAWSIARDGDTYPGTDFVRPLVNTGPSEGWAPSGCVFYTGEQIPRWQNRLIVGALRGQHVAVVTIAPADGEAPNVAGGTRYDASWMHQGYDAVAHLTLEDELGRVRHVEQGPDGGLYAITSNRDGRAGSGFPTERDDVLVRLRQVDR